MRKLLGTVGQLFLGLVVILLVVIVVLKVLWILYFVDNVALIICGIMFTTAMFLFAYKIGNAVIGEIRNR